MQWTKASSLGMLWRDGEEGFEEQKMEEDVEEGDVVARKGVESLYEQEEGQDRKSSSAKLPRPEELLSSGPSWLAKHWVGLVPANHSGATLLDLTGVPRENLSTWLLLLVTVTCSQL